MSIEQFRSLLSRSEATLDAYCTTLRIIKRHYCENLADLDLSTIRKFVADQKEKNSARTVRRHWSAIKAYIQLFPEHFDSEFLANLDRIEGTVLPQPDSAQWERRIRELVMNRDQVEKVFRSVDTRRPLKHEAMLRVGYDLALRIGELLGLRVGDLRLFRDPPAVQFVPLKKKSSSKHTVPFLMDQTVRSLERYLEEYFPGAVLPGDRPSDPHPNKGETGDLGIDPESYLFYGRRKEGRGDRGYRLVEDKKKRMNERSFLYVFRRILRDAGFEERAEKMRFHDFARHSRATNMLRKTKSLFPPHYRLRHERITTTKKYLHLLPEEIVKEIKRKMESEKKGARK